MTLLVAHPWAQFFTGLLVGCWIGAAIATAGVLLLVGRRIRQLEGVNLLLKTKLKAHNKAAAVRTAGAGSMLVMPPPGSAHHGGGSAMGRIARVN